MQRNNTVLAGVTAVIIAAVLLFSWMTLDDSSDETHISEEVVDAIYGGDYEGLYEMLGDDAKAEFGDAQALQDDMEQVMAGISATYGDYLGKTSTHGSVPTPNGVGDYIVLLYEMSGIRLIVTETDGKVSSFFFNTCDKPSDAVLPKGLKETEVEIRTGDLWALPGLITSSGLESKTAAVLVHGSGAHGMNCEIGGNMIFQQIAWGLAEKGVDILRYDKRTYADPYVTGIDQSRLDIQFETIDDAVSAGRLLKSMGYEYVYLIGHSLGAMMAPAIVEQADGVFEGMISIAGSPRSLSEIQYDQNMDTISAMDDPVMKQFYTDMVNGEMAKYAGINSMTEAELMGTTIFGVSAYYVKTMESLDVPGTAVSLDIPMFFIQGTDDFQVDPEKDFGLWTEILKDNGNAQFMLYQGLNHLLCVSTEPGKGTINEYYKPMTVDQSVIEDMAGFMLN